MNFTVPLVKLLAIVSLTMLMLLPSLALSSLSNEEVPHPGARLGGKCMRHLFELSDTTVTTTTSEEDSPGKFVCTLEIVDFSHITADVTALIRTDSSYGHQFIRLAWHISGTYSIYEGNGGSQGGTIRLKTEQSYEANKGLSGAINALKQIRRKYKDTRRTISFGDICTLAGVVAVHEFGGPRIPWNYGRVDTFGNTPPDGRLPLADAGTSQNTSLQMRTTFARMGITNQEMVALIGAHIIGSCHPENSGYDGQWSPTPNLFNNGFFELLIRANYTPTTLASNKTQFSTKLPGVEVPLIMLPSDMALIQDPNLLPFVSNYAANKTLFFTDFAKAFQKLLELGTRDLCPARW